MAVKITGSGAKNIGMLLFTALKQEQKTRGRTRLTGMLKTGRELKVFTIRQEDLKTFSQEAKRYGVLYCVLKTRGDQDPNAEVDVLARAEDASKISRITERFRLATVEKGSVTTQPQKELVAENPTRAATDRGRPSAPDSMKNGRSDGKTEGKKPSVKKKLESYRWEAAQAKKTRQQARANTLGIKESQAVRVGVSAARKTVSQERGR